jgi:ABC-type hemin transport system ATPase subunit
MSGGWQPPAAIHWARRLPVSAGQETYDSHRCGKTTTLRIIAGRGGTVLLSSNLLTEVQATADHLVIIDHGRVIASGTQDALLTGTGQTLEELFLSRTARKDQPA